VSLNDALDRGRIRGQRPQEYVNTGLQGRRLEALPRRVFVAARRQGDCGSRSTMCLPWVGHETEPTDACLQAAAFA